MGWIKAHLLLAKIAGVVAVLLAFGIALRLYGNRQYDIGVASGTKAEAENTRRAIEEQRLKDQAAFEAERATIAQAKVSFDQAKAAFQSDKRATTTAINGLRESIATKQREESSVVLSTPDAGLFDLNIKLHADLRASPSLP